MKTTKLFTLAAVLAFFAGESYAAGSHSTPCYFDGKTLNIDSGCSLNVKSGGALNLNAGSTEANLATRTTGGSNDVSGVAFSNALTGNPSTLTTFQSLLTASANAGVNILASTGTRKIYPGAGFSIMVSGTASGATSVLLECSPSATVIATFPIATLVDGVPVGPFASANIITRGKPLTQGCSAADAVMLSVNGTLATTSQVFVNLPYTVQ